MKKIYTYKHCYQILGIKSGCNWQETRKSYKKAIQKWHPDRFEEGSSQKIIADDKIRNFNIAYDQINRYYRDNGALPPIESPSPANPPHEVNKKQNSPDSKTTATSRPSRKHSAPSSSRPNQQSKSSNKRLIAGFIVLTLAFTYVYISTDDVNTKETHYTAPELDYSPEIVKAINTSTKLQPDNAYQQNNNIQKNTNNDQSGNVYFTIGSSISDVISAQGTPTNTDGDIWYYDKSEVHFTNGIVSHWIRSSETPLKANLKPKTLK